MGTGFELLVTAHLVCVVGGFGYLAYSGLTLVVGRRRGAPLAVLEVATAVGTLPELLIYGAFIFGVAAVGSSGGSYKFSQVWVWSASVAYLAALGVLHGVIRPARRRYVAAATAFATAERSAVAALADPPPDPSVIAALEGRIAVGWGAFNVIVVAVIALMVFQPGV